MATSVTERGMGIDGETIVKKTITVTSGASVKIDEALPATTESLVALTLDVSQVKSWYMSCDQVVTVNTNDVAAGVPAETFVLAANVPLEWTEQDGTVNLLGTDITALYVNNQTASVANFVFKAVYDPTV